MFTRRRVALGAGLALLVALAVLVSPDAVFARTRSVVASPWFPALLVALYLFRPFVGWPVSLLSALVGYRYGLAVGLPIALVGAVFTSLVPFAAGRYVAPRDGFLGRFATGSERYFSEVGHLRGLIAVRLAPTPAEATSTAAGAAGVSLSAFVVGTALGELPWTVAAVLAGRSLARFDPGSLSPDPRLVVAAVAVAALLLAGPAYRHLVTD
ncbi:MAG: TVP38/TMEM64 family protein [Haloarculaceae archaeon]